MKNFIHASFLILSLGLGACGKDVDLGLTGPAGAASGKSMGNTPISLCEKVEVLCRGYAPDTAARSKVLEARFCLTPESEPVTSSSHKRTRIAQVYEYDLATERADSAVMRFEGEVFRKSSNVRIGYFRKIEPPISSSNLNLMMHIELDHPSCIHERDAAYGVLILPEVFGQKIEMKCKVSR